MDPSAEALTIWNPSCSDILQTGLAYNNLIEYTIVNPFSSLVDDSCGGCPLDAPYCQRSNSTCLKPTCQHATAFCSLPTEEGVRARQVCPSTCGCDQPFGS